MSRLMILLASVCIAGPIAGQAAAQAVDRVAVNGILDQGLNHSEVMQTAAHLTDRIGGRMTNSPQMRETERWAQERFRDWGLSNVRTEGFEFGRGWSIVQSSASMTSPRPIALRAIPVAWTPGTNGVISGEVILAPMATPGDLEKWRGKLAGKIVLISPPGTGSEPTEAPFRRWTATELAERNVYQQPNNNPAAAERAVRSGRIRGVDFSRHSLAWAEI